MCLLWEDLSETKGNLASALLVAQGRLGGAFPQRQPWNVEAIAEFPCSLRVHGCRQYMHASTNYCISYKDVPRAYRDPLVYDGTCSAQGVVPLIGSRLQR